MARAEELRTVSPGVDANKRKIVTPLLDEVLYPEKHLTDAAIKVHPQNPELQKVTAAGKHYRELLQTYTNIIDKLTRIYGREEGEEESPLRAFLKGLETR